MLFRSLTSQKGLDIALRPVPDQLEQGGKLEVLGAGDAA